MAKKTKGKQKQDEKGATENVALNPLPATGNAMDAMGTVVRANSPVGAEISTWGNAANNWGNAEPQAGDTWRMTRQEPEEAWGDHTASLLQPPGPAHGILPTIPEQASEYNQHGRSLSDIGENRGSQDYSSAYDSRQDSPDPRYAEGQQNQNLTATAAPSAIGSPRPPPVISITEAAHSLIGQKVNSASEAARRLEEQQRSRLNAHPIHAPGTSPAIHFETLKDHPNYMAGAQTPMSSASAAAALHESTANRLRAQTKKSSKPIQPTVPAPPGKTTWTYPKTLTPGSRPAAAIPPDYSWTMTGGNEWSNKHRQSKSATVHWSQGNANDAWGQQMPQHGQQIPQHMHQGQPARSQAQQRPQHQKHLSHPIHPAQQQRLPPGQNTSWKGWGRDGGQEERSESGTDEDNMYDEWGRGGGDGWRQQGDSGHQRAGGGWGEQKQSQQHAHLRQGDQKVGRGRGEKRADDQWEQDEWGRARQSENGWDQGDAAWGQSNDGWPQGRGHGQQAHGQGRGQVQGQGRGQARSEGRGQLQSENGWGQQEDNGWGQQEDNGWGQQESAWNKADGDGDGGGGGWGKASDAGWGQGNGEWQTGGRASPAEWATAQQKLAGYSAADPAMMTRTMAEQHKVQIMNAMLNQAQNQKNHNMTTAQHQAAQLHAAQLQAQLAATQGAKLPPKATAKESNGWEAYDADNGWGSIDSSDGEYDVDRRVHFSPKRSDLWGGSPRSLPSKTLAQAQQQQGIAATTINLPSGVRFVESKGAAFSFVHNAFFGNARLARERIHWMFPANKDERVANMLAWVQKMSFNLATFGLIKFLETRERGALFLNVLFRMRQYAREPAIDWLTFNQLQSTMDKTLQESVAFYDPSRQVMVFVYLPSQTGNSIAIWRRKINVPDSARTKYQAEINAVTKLLRPEKDYVVMVDELPKAKPKVPQKGQLRKPMKATTAKSALKMKTKDAQGNAKKKRKWWKFFLS